MRVLFGTLLGLAFAALPIRAAVGESGDNIFGLTRLHQVHLTLTPESFRDLEPPPQSLAFGMGSPLSGGPGRPRPGDPDFGAGSMGYDFEYVRASLRFGDHQLGEVGLRYKGNGTYLVSQSQAKRSFKIDTNRFEPDARLDGLTKLNLQSGVMDPSKARDAMAYLVFRMAGVPAPRTSLAEVSISVPGKYDNEYLGLYTVVEQVDKRFLQAHFDNSKGLLLKPEGIRGLPYFGEAPEPYSQSYLPKSKPDHGEWGRLVELTRLINTSGDEEFNARIDAYLDVDLFAKFLAANSFLASLDGFTGLGHNYYLYQDLESDKFVFLPWDLDLAFGAFTLFGTAEQLADLSVDHPYLGPNRLIDRLLTIPKFKNAYRDELRRIVKAVQNEERFGSQLVAIQEVAERTGQLESRAATQRRESGNAMMGGMFQGLPIEEFIRKRVASIEAQLAGEHQGYVPQMQSFGPPRGTGPADGDAAALVGSLDTNDNGLVDEQEMIAGTQKYFAEWDIDRSGDLSPQEISTGLQKLRVRPQPAGRPARGR